jgi:hypothetical protein
MSSRLLHLWSRAFQKYSTKQAYLEVMLLLSCALTITLCPGLHMCAIEMCQCFICSGFPTTRRLQQHDRGFYACQCNSPILKRSYIWQIHSSLLQDSLAASCHL